MLITSPELRLKLSPPPDFYTPGGDVPLPWSLQDQGLKQLGASSVAQRLPKSFKRAWLCILPPHIVHRKFQERVFQALSPCLCCLLAGPGACSGSPRGTAPLPPRHVTNRLFNGNHHLICQPHHIWVKTKFRLHFKMKPYQAASGQPTNSFYSSVEGKCGSFLSSNGSYSDSIEGHLGVTNRHIK